MDHAERKQAIQKKKENTDEFVKHLNNVIHDKLSGAQSSLSSLAGKADIDLACKVVSASLHGEVNMSDLLQIMNQGKRHDSRYVPRLIHGLSTNHILLGCLYNHALRETLKL